LTFPTSPTPDTFAAPAGSLCLPVARRPLNSTLIIPEPGVNLVSESSTGNSVFIGFSIHDAPTIGHAGALRPKKTFFNGRCTKL
jgi:hypothetical protein